MEITLSYQSLDQALHLIISLLALNVTNKIMQFPHALLVIRATYCIFAVLSILTTLYIKRQIMIKNDRSVFKYKLESSPFSAAEDKEIETTNMEYDLEETNKILRATVLQTIMMSVVHYSWGSVKPLIIQVTSFPRNLLLSPLYMAHLYNKKVIRPFEKNMIIGGGAPAVVAETTEAEKKKKKED